jgi:acid phosphatase class B
MSTRKNVAFDFDGVIHVDVSPTSQSGNRHPTFPRNLPAAPNKFKTIIELIHKYHKHNYNVYIVTARMSYAKDMIIQTLINYGVKHIIPDHHLYFTGDLNQNGDKVSTLEQLNIRDFYDDSIFHFVSIYNAKKNNQLRNLKNCYLTKPEVEQIVRLDI